MIEIEREYPSATRATGRRFPTSACPWGKGQWSCSAGSGSGKTTVTKLINGLIPHFTEGGRLDGRVTAAGQVVAGYRAVPPGKVRGLCLSKNPEEPVLQSGYGQRNWPSA